jgi:hypothetical protein
MLSECTRAQGAMHEVSHKFGRKMNRQLNVRPNRNCSRGVLPGSTVQTTGPPQLAMQVPSNGSFIGHYRLPKPEPFKPPDVVWAVIKRKLKASVCDGELSDPVSQTWPQLGNNCKNG